MLWRALYALVTWVLLPFVLAYFFWRGRTEPAYRRHWRERLGYVARRDDRPIWIHAASVGEVGIARSLIEALRSHGLVAPVLLTTITPTGRAAARSTSSDLTILYAPLDSRGATRRFVRRVAPRIGIVIETELWPHLVGAATGREIPIVLANATISERSADRFRRWPARRAVSWMLSCFDSVLAASAQDAERLRRLGALPCVVRTAGNIKFDFDPPVGLEDRAREQRRDWGAETRLIWVAGSTRDGEESILLQIFESLRQRFPALLLILVPRHPQRFDVVANLLADAGWRTARRHRGDAVCADTAVVLGDTLGELTLFYMMADVVFVGGSLLPGVDGHNMIEPAALGRVFATGPHVAAWRAVLAVLDPTAAYVASDRFELEARLAEWLADVSSREAGGRENKSRTQCHRGALAICSREIARFVDTA